MAKYYSEDSIAVFDHAWRAEIKNHTVDKMQHPEETIEYFSKMLKEWLAKNHIEDRSIEEWKKSFHDYCKTTKETVDEFLQKQYQKEGKENAAEMADNTRKDLEHRCAVHLEDWALTIIGQVDHDKDIGHPSDIGFALQIPPDMKL